MTSMSPDVPQTVALAPPALRLGFELVSSLSTAGAERIEAARATRLQPPAAVQ